MQTNFLLKELFLIKADLLIIFKAEKEEKTSKPC